jgi:hypothetical protein
MRFAVLRICKGYKKYFATFEEILDLVVKDKKK